MFNTVDKAVITASQLVLTSDTPGPACTQGGREAPTYGGKEAYIQGGGSSSHTREATMRSYLLLSPKEWPLDAPHDLPDSPKNGS